MSFRTKRIHPECEVANGWTRWVQPLKRGYILACCDCGLAHHMDFRIYDGRVQFRARRAPGYTARDRNQVHYDFQKVKPCGTGTSRAPKSQLRSKKPRAAASR